MTQDIKKPISEEEKVEVPKSLLEQMQKDMDDMKKQLEDDEYITEDDEVKDHTMRMREFEDKLCIGVNKEKGTWLEYDKNRREDKIMQEIILLNLETGTETVKKIECSFFANNSKEITVKILKINSKENKQPTGKTAAEPTLDDNMKILNNGKRAKLFVTNIIETVDVQLPNGKEINLDINFLNI